MYKKISLKKCYFLIIIYILFMGSSQSTRIKIKQFSDKTAKCLIYIKNNIKRALIKFLNLIVVYLQ